MLLKSPVNRIGGKAMLVNWLSGFIPDHTLYCEPFCGAGHLLFSKSPSPVEVINDIDNHLIAFFQVVKNCEKRQKLIETLEYMPYSRALWQGIRSKWKQGDLPQDEIERVAWWYYLNRTTFSGDQKRGGFAIPSTTGRNPAQSYYNAIDSLEHIAKRLRGVTIECLDYADCIQRYDSETTLFYCDPPYWNVEHFYGDNFTENDHYQLSDLLHSVKAKVMLSHYECDIYNELYSIWNKYTFESFKGGHKAAPGTGKPKTQEVLYCNFEPLKTRSLFDAME